MIPMEQGMELSMMTGISTSYDPVVMIPNKFHSPKTYLLPKCSFGSENKKRSLAWRALILQVIIPHKILALWQREITKNVH